MHSPARHSLLLVEPAVSPPLDPGFRPASLGNRAFQEAVKSSNQGVPLRISLERGDGSISTFETEVFDDDAPEAIANFAYAERLLKFLLWQRGAWRVMFGGPPELGDEMERTFSPHGERAFDTMFMGRTVYEQDFTLEVVPPFDVPDTKERSTPMGRHLSGCRIGFDLGASDRKTSAVIDGKDVFSEEIPWDPRSSQDWNYQYEGIKHSIQRALEHLPRLDAIGGSAAGVYVNNRTMAASLFRGIPSRDFDQHIKPLFDRIGEEFGVPIVVVNDGEVTALAGAMSLESDRILGVAMGSSEAAGYVDGKGNITGWLNELAFAPVDYALEAPEDEWSGDVGCGVQYFSQQAVMRLSKVAGIKFDKALSVPERLVAVQELMAKDDDRAAMIYETVGVHLGYAIAHYADYYDIDKMLILGRVTTGKGGDVVLSQARRVLKKEFPELARRVEMMLPDEKLRRIGQAIAAASLPVLEESEEADA